MVLLNSETEEEHELELHNKRPTQVRDQMYQTVLEGK